ncbi:uncharacterized protein C19orf44 homolog [Porphyrio hochstetteri]
MAAIARARAEGHGDAPRRTGLPAGRSGLLLPFARSGFAGVDAELERTGRAASCRGRFLTVRSENAPGMPRCRAAGGAGQAASGPVAKSGPGSASHTRSSSALRKAAQLESRIRDRKKQMELQTTDVDREPWDEETFSSASSREPSARGKKYLKNYSPGGGTGALSKACSKEEQSSRSPKVNLRVKQQLGLDSDEEEMRELMESSLEFSSRSKHQRIAKDKTPVSSGKPPPLYKEISPTEVSKTSFHSKDSEKSVSGRVNSPTPSPASRNLSVQRHVRAQSLSSSTKDNTVKITLPQTGNTKQSQGSLERNRSEIKSLDELFSEADDAEDRTHSGSDDFRLNILSLDDLAPSISSETAELKHEGTDIQLTQESNRNPQEDAFLVKEDQASLQISAVSGVKDVSGEDSEKHVTEAEISEHLSGVSADFPRHKQDFLEDDERTVNSEYSDDFETSVSTTDRKSVSETSEERSEHWRCSGKHSPSASPPLFAREQRGRVHRVTVKETAVQTVDLPFTYCWPKTNTRAVLDPPVGHTYIDPVPIASHVISTDAVEALTAYSPSALVLNAMLKQHLLLTQQFVENIHQLHFSLVESLENEKFHYHTLEETKEYIKNHKSPPLTLKQAREQIRKAQEEKLL